MPLGICDCCERAFVFDSDAKGRTRCPSCAHLLRRAEPREIRRIRALSRRALVRDAGAQRPAGNLPKAA
jgi:hypothetical protein